MAAQTARGNGQAAERAEGARVLVRPLRDPAAIRALLEPRRTFAAYAIGQLAPRLFPYVHCWHAEGERGDGLVLHSSGGLGEAMFAMGEPDAVDAPELRHLSARPPTRAAALLQAGAAHDDGAHARHGGDVRAGEGGRRPR